jgi:SNF2 family DNA or RNA helicase
MNFLDPEEWRDLEALEKEHEELTEDLVKQLHGRLKPYFLRRIKSEVLQLPPKVSLRLESHLPYVFSISNRTKLSFRYP